MLLGVSKSRAALLLSVLAVSSTASRLVVGWVADSPGVDSVVLYSIALLIAGAATCTLPALRSYQLLCGYQLVYGVCCGEYLPFGGSVAQWLGRWIRDREVASSTPGGCVSE